ncbi:MAG: YdiU family protein [Rhodoferax sp.]
MDLFNPRALETVVEATLRPVELGSPWRHPFADLGEAFYTRIAPHPLPDPYWVGHSPAVAQQLGLDPDLPAHPEWLQALAGNRPIRGTQPLASVYSGHQFGHWAGQLGDGRAILLGSLNGLEVQLKGSGLTPYSRQGDGRAVLRSSIREFLASEAMAALGVPTTRALCVVGSDAPVVRERIETAAVVTRVAPSFIRFGHFEHFSARNQIEPLRRLADAVLQQFYPECLPDRNPSGPGNAYARLLHAVVRRTAQMVAHWQAVGFCHGVMNTDNMSILGLTLDYGPFQFMDGFDPGHICNHTDRGGRYAFDQQPAIAHWNLYALAQALLPLIGAQEPALEALAAFEDAFTTHWRSLMRAKLGLPDAQCVPDTQFVPVLTQLLQLLAADGVDYPLFWRRLSLAVAEQAHSAGAALRADQTPHGAQPPAPAPALNALRELFIQRAALDAWMLRYQEFLTQSGYALAADLMLKTNPSLVLRNYWAQDIIQAAQARDYTPLRDALQALSSPFEAHPALDRYAGLPPAWAGGIVLSCSS